MFGKREGEFDFFLMTIVSIHCNSNGNNNSTGGAVNDDDDASPPLLCAAFVSISLSLSRARVGPVLKKKISLFRERGKKKEKKFEKKAEKTLAFQGQREAFIRLYV